MNKVDVKINDKSINDPTNSWYAYKSYFENHLSYSKGTKSNLLSYRGYFNDTSEKLDDVGSTSTESANEGFIIGFSGSRDLEFTNIILCIFM